MSENIDHHTSFLITLFIKFNDKIYPITVYTLTVKHIDQLVGVYVKSTP